jgi:hypothetical protein
MARPTHKAVATVGKYTDKDGVEKKRYMQCGVVFTDEQGRQSMKLDGIPVTPEWSGWISLFPMDDDRQEERPRNSGKVTGDGRSERKRPASQPAVDDGDDIPF